jgi:adenylate cyclase
MQERNRSAPGPRIGHTRIGVHRGNAVVGNFGGNDRIQYTALGDAMNTAARLESANKGLGSYTLVSSTALEGIAKPVCRSLGRITLRGRAEPIEVHEPVDDEHLATTQTALVRRFDAGDVDALTALRALAESRPDDMVLARLVSRFETLEPGGSYVVS